MINQTGAHQDAPAEGATMWLEMEVRPARVALFRRWAQHLGLSDADLAARIFTCGTWAVALQTNSMWPPHPWPQDAASVVDAELDRLAARLGLTRPESEAPDA